MYMMRGSSAPNGYSKFVLPLLIVFLVSFPCVLPTGTVAEDDVRCLRGIKDSLQDPLGRLSTWTFSNSWANYICQFAGVTCWNDRENRLLGLQLRGFSLSGAVPESLKYCGALQNLDLSRNQLSGSIPDICSWLPYLVYIDLSDNLLTGSIPPDLSNCVYLNGLRLQNNRLSGNIPDRISSLARLKAKEFSVAGNDLEGSIPLLLSNYGEETFRGNSGLCGSPLKRCGGGELCDNYCCWCFWCGYGAVLWVWLLVVVLRGIWYGEVRRGGMVLVGVRRPVQVSVDYSTGFLSQFSRTLIEKNNAFETLLEFVSKIQLLLCIPLLGEHKQIEK